MLKPDAVQRGLIGKIIQRFEEKGCVASHGAGAVDVGSAICATRAHAICAHPLAASSWWP